MVEVFDLFLRSDVYIFSYIVQLLHEPFFENL
jgi:hypothetical protein